MGRAGAQLSMFQTNHSPVPSRARLDVLTRAVVAPFATGDKAGDELQATSC